jgi:hypothetical protein
MRFSGTIPFERSLRLDEAGDSGAILTQALGCSPNSRREKTDDDVAYSSRPSKQARHLVSCVED